MAAFASWNSRMSFWTSLTLPVNGSSIEGVAIVPSRLIFSFLYACADRVDQPAAADTRSFHISDYVHPGFCTQACYRRYRSGCGAHAARNVAALESRPCRRRGAEDPLRQPTAISPFVPRSISTRGLPLENMPAA